jgi:hypothetical protein
MTDLCVGHPLQSSRATWKDARKVVRDGVIEPGDAVGKDSGDRSGKSVPSERTEERLERLLDHVGKRSECMLHGGVPGMSCIYLPKTSVPTPHWQGWNRKAKVLLLTIENGRECPGPSRWWHLPMLYALPVLSPKFVQLTRLKVYRVNSTH